MQCPPTRPGLNGRKFHLVPAADALVLAVSHRRYLEMPSATLLRKVVRQGCIIDVKGVLDAQALRKEGLRVWRL